MKRSDIFKIILSEASNRPIEEVEEMYSMFIKLKPMPGLDVEMPDPEAAQLLIALRKELPGIRYWLIQGGILANPGDSQGTA